MLAVCFFGRTTTLLHASDLRPLSGYWSCQTNKDLGKVHLQFMHWRTHWKQWCAVTHLLRAVRMSVAAVASKPDVGSSMNSKEGLETSSKPMLTLLRCPPLHSAITQMSLQPMLKLCILHPHIQTAVVATPSLHCWQECIDSRIHIQTSVTQPHQYTAGRNAVTHAALLPVADTCSQ